MCLEHVSSIHEWQFSVARLGYTNRLLPHPGACVPLLQRHDTGLLFMSFYETLKNLLLLTTLTCSVASYYTYKHLSFLICKMGIISIFRDSVEDEMR